MKASATRRRLPWVGITFVRMRSRPEQSQQLLILKNPLQGPRFEQRPGGAGPVAVQALLLRRHLTERLPCPRDQEHRVIAESRLAAPFRHDLAPAFALKELGRVAWS